jgi:phage terminase Nu1 subunit (DNA packaging protein)
MQRELFSKSKLATEMGLDRRTLDKILDGLAPEKTGTRNAKLYYLRDVISALLSHEEEKRKSKVASSPEEKDAAAAQMANARLRKEVAEAEMVELKLAEAKKELVDAGRVAEIWANLAASFRSRLLSIPSRLSLETQGLDRRAVERRADELVREALDELSREDEDEEDGDAAQPE